MADSVQMPCTRTGEGARPPSRGAFRGKWNWKLQAVTVSFLSAGGGTPCPQPPFTPILGEGWKIFHPELPKIRP